MLGVGLSVLAIQQGYTIDVGNGPVEPFAFADFQNAAYVLDGSSSTFDAFLGSDPDNWNAFNPDDYMVADEGLVSGGGGAGPVISSTLAARLLASGFTATINWLADDANGSKMQFVLTDVPNFANFWEVEFKHQQSSPETDNSHIATANTPFYAMSDIGAGEHRIAFTWDANGCRCSIDGGAVDGVSDTLDLSLINFIAINFAAGTWRSMGLYPAQADAGLPMLSTG